MDRNGLEILTRHECLRLLGKAAVGRVAITAGALPSILPVSYRLVDDEIVFRTGEGSKLEAATKNAVVAFEVDDVDLRAREGWSVVVTGVAREVRDQDELEVLAEMDIPRWAPTEADRFVAVSTELISGRRLIQELLA